MPLGVALVCVAIAVAGSAVQSSIGLGFGLLSTPFLAMIDTAFVPAAVLIAVLPLSVIVAVTSWPDVDWSGAGLATVGRLPGVVAGAIVVASLSSRALAIGLGLAVLVAVVVSVRLPAFRLRTGYLVVAGAISGFMGTVSGVGGPPMAIVYQRGHPRIVRATLAAFFAVGTVLSLVALVLAGGIGRHELALGALLTPGVVIGIVASKWVRPVIEGPRFRPVLLAVCAASALVLLAKQL